MEFEKNKKNISLYDTPYGILELEIDTRDLNIEMNDDGGNIYIYYDMCISGQQPQETTLKIDIKPE